MRPLTNKYPGNCRKCGVDLPVGKEVIYEKRVGIFCPACAPTDPEEIRIYRQEGADRKADKLEGWAEKRRTEAETILDHNRKHYFSDIAFTTQPGRMPFRDRIYARHDRALESLDKAKKMEGKAERLRHVRVAGDAEITRQAKRERVKSLLRIGQEVESGIYGKVRILKINQKTATVLTHTYHNSGIWDENKKGFTVDLSFLTPIVPNEILLFWCLEYFFFSWFKP